MSERGGESLYRAAIQQLRETSKWIVAAAAGMAALALGSSPLTGLGSLRPGIRLWLAIIAGVLGLLGVATVVSFAVRVLIGRTLIISDVVNKSKYAKHRKEIYRRIGYRFPRQEAAEADRWNIFDDAFLLKCEHQQRSGSENERREGRDGLNVVMLILENAALIETQKRFDELCLDSSSHISIIDSFHWNICLGGKPWQGDY